MSGRWVPCMIFGILGLSVVANIIMIRYAVADPSFIIEPGYYDEALAWDARAEQQRVNAVLGWNVSASLQKRGSEANLIVDIRDADGAELRDATYSVDASPNLCAKQRAHVVLENGRGVVGRACPGLWRIDLVVQHGSERYGERRVIELAP